MFSYLLQTSRRGLKCHGQIPQPSSLYSVPKWVFIIPILVLCTQIAWAQTSLANRAVTDAALCASGDSSTLYLESDNNSPYFRTQTGAFIEFDNDSAVLYANVVNLSDPNVKWTINLVFSGRTYTTPLNSPIAHGCPAASFSTNDWYYYTGMTGTLVGTGTLSGTLLNLTLNGPAFQLGTGANAYDNLFGAIAQANFSVQTANPYFNAHFTGNFTEMAFHLSGTPLPQTCNNITNAGSIGYDETYCGTSFDPSPIVNLVLPSGGTGTIEYVWLMTTDSLTAAGAASNYNVIFSPTALSASYDPSTISQTTWFRRCARRQGCPNNSYVETPWIKKEVVHAQINGLPNTVCTFINVPFSATTLGSGGAFYSWSFGSDATPASSTSASPTVQWTAAGNKTVVLFVTAADSSCMTIASQIVNVTTCNTCNNVTSAGSISGAESLCGTYNPAIINELSAPSGGSGNLEYMWEYSLDSLTFSAVAGANAATYDPSSISQTTWFRRLSKRSGCTTYDGVSNWVKKEVKAQPTASFTTTLGSVNCIGQLGDFAAQTSNFAANYFWDFDGASPANSFQQNVFNVSWATAGIKNVKLVVQNLNGCVDSITTNVIVSPGPGAQITAVGNTSFCAGSNPSLILKGKKQNVAYYEYRLDNVIVSSFSAADSNYVVPTNTLSVGSHVYTLTTKDANGCTSSANITVNVNSVSAIASNAGPYCVGNPIVLNGNAIGGQSPYTYSWAGAAITPSLVNMQSPILTGVGGATGSETGVYTLYVFDANGCSSTDTTAVNVRVLTSGAFTQYTSNCGSFDPPTFVETTPATIQNGVGNEVIEYLWLYLLPNAANFAMVSGSAGQWSSANATYNAPLGLDSIYVTNGKLNTSMYFRRCARMTVNGVQVCSIAETPWFLVEILKQPNVTATGGAGCLGSDIALNSTASVTSPAAITSYNWAGPNGFSATLQNPLITNLSPASAGVYTLTVVATQTTALGSSASCSATDTATISIGASPVLTISPANNTTFCNGASIQFNVSGAQTYSWYGPNGFSSSLANPQITNSTAAATGKYYVMGIGVNNCISLDSVFITAGGSLTINETHTDETCVATGTGAIDITPLGGTAPYTYSWYDGEITQDRTGLYQGVYAVLVTDNGGCQGTQSVIINTTSYGPNANILLSMNAACVGQIITATATSPSAANNTYNWSFGINSAPPFANGIGPVNFSYSTPGTKNLVLTIHDSLGCETKITDIVNVTICAGSSIGDYVWNDENKNGIQDGAEVGVANVPVSLYLNNVIIASTVTDAYGFYNFPNLAPATTYKVGVSLPVDYTFSPKAQTGNNLDSDINPATGLSDAIALASGQNLTNVDAGIYYTSPAKSAIGNYVWFDANGNGTQDGSEVGIANVSVNLYKGATLFGSTVTDGEGYYYFTNLTAGTYTVEFIQPAGYVFTTQDAGANTIASDKVDSDADLITGKTAAFSLALGENKSTLDAGFVPMPSGSVSIGDFVWNDLNQNGIQEAGEFGLSGVTVTLYDNTNTAISTTTSSATGYYVFNNVTAGTYTIGFTAPSGMAFAPQAATSNDKDSDVNPSGNTNSFIVAANEILTSIDAGLYFTTPAGNGKIGDFVWYDLNGNGAQDANENGAAGIIVTLYDNTNAPVTSTVSNINGYYAFANLALGTYSVGFSNLPVGFSFTSQTLNTANGSDADVNTGKTTTFTLTAIAPQNNDIDAGIKATLTPGGNASIGNFVWNDFNNNGIQELGENGVGNVTVTLYQSNGTTVISSTTTTPTGYYLFSNLAAGNYVVGFSSFPTGYNLVAQNAAGSNVNNDSDPNTVSGKTPILTLTEGQDNLSVDAGLNKAAGTTATVGNFVWNDANQNGIQDATENGVAGVSVILLDNNNFPFLSTTTDGNGFYLFTQVPAGLYKIAFGTLPAGFSFTPKNAFGSNTTNNSDVNVATGVTDAFNLNNSQINLDIDAGIYSNRASIGDFVWNDTNGNGVQDASELGIAGITVTLFDNSNNPVTSTITNANGFYNFVNLNAGTYSLGFSTLPTGAIFSPKNATNDNSDSDVNPATGRTDAFTVVASTINNSFDAGIIPNPMSSLYGYVWKDENHNGLQDVNEPSIGGMTVTLLDVSNSPVAVTVSDGNGVYNFTNIMSGTYNLQFTGLPNNSTFTLADQGSNDQIDSDVNPTDGTSVTSYTVGVGESKEAADAGVKELFASIGDYVWNDTNKDGIQDATEVGVSGVVVTLYKANGNVVATTTTDAYGKYQFNDVISGNYYLGFSLPISHVFSPKDQTNDNEDSDVNPTTGLTAIFFAPAGVGTTNQDAGVYYSQPLNANIGDRVWFDANGNGTQDGGEQGYSGAQVSLYNAANQLIASTITNGNGNYLFSNLAAGVYYVKFDLPLGYIFTAQNVGSNDLNSDANVSTGKTANIIVSAGTNNMDIDAGLVKTSPTLANIGDFVWNDVNGNGVQDAAEPGIADIQVELYDNTNVLVASTITNVLGYYTFNGVAAGNYQVKFITTPAYTFTTKDVNSDDNVDSDADPLTGNTNYFAVVAGDNNVSIDAGLKEVAPAGNARLGNYVWYDADNNGLQGVTETGAAGVTVRLYNGANTLVNTTVTDANGFYYFVNLAAGTYVVEFANLPTGYQFTTQTLNTATGSDANVSTGKTPAILLAANTLNYNIDAGLVIAPSLGIASIGDFVWNDENNNGVQDVAELGMGGVTVTLYDNTNTAIATTTTNATGYYIFNNLSANTYTVGFSNLPSGYAFSPKDLGGNDNKDSDVNTGTGKTDAFTLSTSQNRLNIDAGLHNPTATASIGDFVWNDANNNGIQEFGELGVQGVSVTLMNKTTNLAIASTVTNANGAYKFSGLSAGNYQVKFGNLPAGFGFSAQAQGGNQGLDSDADAAGTTPTFALANAQNKLDIDAGIYSNRAAIGNYVWFDVNENAEQDANENGVGGISVALYDNTNTLITSTVTDGNGFYSFPNLFPASYKLAFSNIPTGTLFTSQDLGGDDEKDSDVGIDGKTAFFTVNASDINYSFDAGIISPNYASLTGLAWFDVNADGQRLNELFVTGVTVTLYNSVNVAVAVTTTNANGQYFFNNVVQGTYAVGFSNLPPSSILTTQNQGNDLTDSDPDAITGKTASITLNAGQHVGNVDAGIIPPVGSIGNYVWLDDNKNGLQDELPSFGKNGVMVQLWNAGANEVSGGGDDALVATKFTANDISGNPGYYQFSGVPSGKYFVKFPVTNGVASLTTSTPTLATDGNSDANVFTGNSPIVTIDALGTGIDKDNNTIDAGYIIIPSLCASTCYKQDTIFQTVSLPRKKLTISNNVLNINKFDPSLGELAKVEIQARIVIDSKYKVENEDALPSEINLTTTGTGNVKGLGLPPAGTTVSYNESRSLGVLAEGDGFTFSGPDYVEDSLVMGDFYSTPISNALAGFVGTGTIPYTVNANGGFFITGPSNYVAQVSTFARVELTVRYIYCHSKCTSVGDYVWNDLNKNGLQDSNEVGVSGVNVALYDTNDKIVVSTTTDAYGKYLFSNLTPNQYYVGFSLPIDYIFTRQNNGVDDDIDSDPNPLTGKTDVFTLNQNDSIRNIDAGIFYSNVPSVASLGDYVWLDTNANGLQDADEVGVANVTVNLLDASGKLINSTITNEEGKYLFAGLTPTTYKVSITLPMGYKLTTLDAGNDELDSDFLPTSATTTAITLLAGENNSTIDAGLVEAGINTASLGDYVWNDLNKNGLQDAGENGLPNVLVTLTDSLGATRTTRTNAFGYYIFNNLPSSHYVVKFSLPTGFQFSPSNQGADDNTDSDVTNLATGETDVVILFPKARITTVDAGMYETAPAGTAALGNFVWYDDNKDGLQGNLELGVAGVLVTLFDNTNTAIATASTNGNGFYQFTSLAAGVYYVKFENIPNGFQFTHANAGNDAKDSDADETTGFTSSVPLAAGEYNDKLDAGIFVKNNAAGAASIGDYVWNDVNNNGLQDSLEVGVPNVKVTLLDASSTVITTTITDATGYYIFNNLTAGSYYVQFSDLPAGFSFSPKNQGTNDNKDSDVNSGTGETDEIILASGVAAIYAADAGLYNPAATSSIGDYVWNDKDVDGMQDAGEAGVGGISVTLYNSVTSQIVQTTTTNANGFYFFTGLPAASYFVVFSNLPTGFSFSPKYTTSIDKDNNANPDGRTDVFTLAANTTNRDIDAGIHSTRVAIGNYVWNDENKNGIQEPTEPSVAGVTVTLYDNNGDAVANAVTNGSGFYYFVNIEAGTYSLGFSTLPDAARFTVKDAGANLEDDKDSDVNPLTGRTDAFTVVAGDINYTFDAGLQYPNAATVTGYVWTDDNQDGLQTAGELGVAGVTVYLINGDGQAISTTVTGANGIYQFSNVEPGLYIVRFTTIPSGTSFTTPNAGNDLIDSDVDDVVNGFANTPFVVLASQDNNGSDAGLIASASICGRAWQDDDADSQQSQGEVSIPNVSVTLFQANGAQVGETLTTDQNGNYQFLGLKPGAYYVVFGSIFGRRFAIPNVGGDLLDSDADSLTGRAPFVNGTNMDTLVLRAGQVCRKLDVGYSPSGVYPVILTSFTAEWSGKDGLIKWETSLEKNLDYYELYRSYDDNLYEPILRKYVNGNSSSSVEYKHLDKGVALNGQQKIYYQLLMIDKDGSQKSSDKVELLLLNSVAPIYSNVYPNPATTQISLEYHLDAVKNAEVSITNNLGQEVYHTSIKQEPQLKTLNIEAGDWARGVYIIRVSSDEGQTIHKVVLE